MPGVGSRILRGFCYGCCHLLVHHGQSSALVFDCTICTEMVNTLDGSRLPLMNGGLTTKDYIEDYCIHRIRQDARNTPNFEHVRDDPCNAVAARIRAIGTQIETSNPDFFARVCDQLNVSANTAYAQFKDLADELFRDSPNGHQGVSWGRIAALIAFSGRLALHCATHDMEDMVPSVIGWTARYLDNNLNNWMREHDGWDGFMRFFDSSDENNRAQEALEAFMKKAFTYAAVGVVVAGLASMIMKR